MTSLYVRSIIVLNEIYVFYVESTWRFVHRGWHCVVASLVSVFSKGCNSFTLDRRTLKTRHHVSSKCLELLARRDSAMPRKSWIFISAAVANSGIKISVLESTTKTFDNWRWNHYAVSKRRTQITNRFNATSQKKECLKCTSAKAGNLTFNLLAGLPWPRVKSRCHGRSERRDQFRSPRCCWHVCRTCLPQASERWCCDVTAVW